MAEPNGLAQNGAPPATQRVAQRKACATTASIEIVRHYRPDVERQVAALELLAGLRQRALRSRAARKAATTAAQERQRELQPPLLDVPTENNDETGGEGQ